MKRIYICGPYSADNIMDVLKNIRTGQNAAAVLMRTGYAVYAPHLDYQLALCSMGGCLTKEQFQANSMAWVEVSDAVFVLPGWEESIGSMKELARAKALNIPIFEDLTSLHEWDGRK